MSEKQELIDRWSGFISKIESRMDEILEQAEAGTAQMIPQLEYDSISVSNAWTGIKSQMFSLQEKIADTWDEKMDDMFSDLDDVSGDERMEQYYRGTDAKHQMETKYDMAERKAIAEAGRKILDNVMEHVNMNKLHHCKNCGDKMDINIYSFMAKNVKCPSCSTVNSYEPDGRILALEGYSITALANEKVASLVKEEEDLSYEIYKLDIREDRPAIEALREKLVAARKERINTFYDFIIQNVPDKSEFYDRKRVERLKWAEDVSNT